MIRRASDPASSALTNAARIPAALAATVLCAGLLACSAPTLPPSTSASAATAEPAAGAIGARLATVATPLWAIDERSIGTEAIVVGDTVIAYAQRPDIPIALVGLDATTGAERWVREASMQDLQSTRLTPRVVGDGAGGALVAITSPPVGVDAGWESHLHLLDPRTGEIRASVDDRWVSVFTDCGHPDGGICFSATEVGVDDQRPFHLAPDGAVEPFAAAVEGFESSRPVGAGTYAVRQATGDVLVRQVEGVERWRTPAAEITGGVPWLVDNVGSWYLEADADVLLGMTSIQVPEGAFSVSNDDFRTSAVDLETGQVRWSREHGSYCGSDVEVTVLCTAGMSGVRAEPGGPIEIQWADAVSLAGVDTRTGEEAWTHDVDGFSGTFERDGVRSFERGFVFRSDAGVEVIDTATGDRALLRPGEAVACTADVSFDAPHWSLPEGEPTTTAGGVAVRACTAGDDVDDPSRFSEAVVLGSASWTWTPTGPDPHPELRVVLTPGQIAAYRL